ncbi:hypothetical protein [Sphingopyxis sp.]|uniref:hypothetical protein n=1 Tax=Sphingopyxis sp. TaxID=1908224 RepID=UPI003D0A4541
MTESGRVRQRRRPLLLLGLGLSLIWALYWFWPVGQPKPDFMIETSPTESMEFEGHGSNAKPHLPYYKDGQFFSADGRILSPKDVIRDDRHPDNIDSLQFAAPFFLDDSATQADFSRAIEKIWDVCDVPIFIVVHGQSEIPGLLPVKERMDCASVFPNPANRTPLPQG